MRTPVLVGVVILVHCVAVGSVVLIQGCGTLPTDSGMPEPPKMPPQITSDNVMPQLIPDDAAFTPVDSTTYVVRKGDSLSVIARKHGLSTLELSALNNITNPNMIREGQRLLIPGGGTSTPVSVPKPVVRRTVKPEGPVYTVKNGDSLSVIAHAYGVNIADIKAANGLTGNKIYVKQKLTIPSPTKTPSSRPPAVDSPRQPVADEPDVTPPVVVRTPPEPPRAPSAPVGVLKDYTVEDGDDIFSIAMMWGVSVSKIREVNDLKDGELEVGRKIKIPLSDVE